MQKSPAPEFPDQFQIELPGRIFYLKPPNKKKGKAWMDAIEHYMAAQVSVYLSGALTHSLALY
jgi:hypothetical protein